MSDALWELARRCGVQTSFWTVDGVHQHASPEALVSVLAALGHEIASPEDAPVALAAHDRAHAAQVIEPCAAVWQGEPARIALGPAAAGEAVHAAIDLESGQSRGVTVRDGYVDLGAALELGYHRLVITHGGAEHVCSVICAPPACYAPEAGARVWGVFAPLYAQRSARSDRFGGPDLTDLGRTIDWVRSRGGQQVATLPLLAGFDDNPSPYMPISRRFWNEMYLDLSLIPEVGELPADVIARGEELAATEWFEYERLVVHRRRALDQAARRLYAAPSGRRDALEAWVAAHPLVDEYAAFRGGDDEHARRYHRYVQWLCRQQLETLADKGLYLDLPVGVHPDGFDAHREGSLFAAGMSVGAPPDALFGGGQDWSMPALHPQRSRAQGHRYFAECVRAHVELAAALRIDHVMGLYRRYWIPAGFGPTQGVYVRLPADELVAVLALESHRHRTVIVGEDLGTVEPRVREDMDRRAMRRMYVAQFDFHAPIPPGCVASLNTHDTPPFAACWQDWDKRAALIAQLERLAASDAWLVMVTLEDLWLETRQQNVPGTTTEHPNWRGKMRRRVDELPDDADAIAVLERVNAARQAAGRRSADATGRG